MRRIKKCMSAVTAAALILTALPVSSPMTARAEGPAAADATVNLSFVDASVFHDTDGDGLGEFEGWGTSLCWWANRLGYDETLTTAAAKAFYSPEGLNMNIGRYNVGGGDLVGETPTVEPNEKAVVYDLSSDYGYEGSSGKKDQIDFKDIVYSDSDADFGFTKGKNVGTVEALNYINELGAEAGDGANVSYTVNVEEAGQYTIKLLLTLTGTNKRAAAIKVNDTDHVADYGTVNKGLIAQGKVGQTTHNLFCVAFSNVSLKAGDNTVLFGGNGEQADGGDSWGLDFIKMLVVKSGEEGVLPETPEFLHPEHIKRSDSAVPGYWKDVTKMDLSKKSLAEYQKEFARADETSGYAWNYDWKADQRQWNVLQAAMEEHGGSDFLAEAFSNSPPYFMTNSGCSSGATDSSKNNLREDCYKAFAGYMADVIVHWAEVKASGANDGVYFMSATPMNEPYTSYWGANSAKQEGCHFDQGDSESNMIIAFYEELQAKADTMSDGPAKDAVKNIIISGTDETSIDTQIDSYKKLSDEAKSVIQRIDTHTYGGSKRTELKELAMEEGKNLWMSEIDGSNLAGTKAGEMAPGLGLAQRIMTDLNGLKSSAWILWNAIDINIDSNNEFDANSLEELKTKKNDDGTIMYDPDRFDELKYGFWGIAIADHDKKELIKTRKYYAYGQFSKFIRPGYTIIESDNGQSVAAYDPKGDQAVVVALNTSSDDKTWKFNFDKFKTIGSSITAIRTSGTSEAGENWKDVTSEAAITVNTEEKYFTSALKGNSITTFIIQDVVADKESIKEEKLLKDLTAEEEKLTGKIKTEIIANLQGEEILLSSSMVTGTEPWKDSNGNNGGNTVDKVVDNKLDTFFDGEANGWVQIDLGESKKIGALGYAPRKGSGFADRIVNASFYGSNDEGDEKSWTKLYTITSEAQEDKITTAAPYYETLNQSYRYIRYEGSGSCNVAELKVYSQGDSFTYVELPEEAAGWVAYCQKTLDPNGDYSKVKRAAFESAAADVVNLSAAASEVQKKQAVNALLNAYFALKESSSAEDPLEQTISGPQTSYTKTEGDAAFRLNAVTNGNGALSYSSSNPEVADVSQEGLVTIKKAGTAKITIKAAATAEYGEASFTLTVTVNPKKTDNGTPDDGKQDTAKAEQIISVKSAYTKTYGNKAFNLGAKLAAGNGALSYTSSNSKVAAVSGAGKVTLKAPGYAVITITAAATDKYKEATAAVELKVRPKKVKISSVKSQTGKKLKASWKKDATVTGYEIQASLTKNFKKVAKKATVKKAKTVSTTLKGLKKGKKYYVRVRAYKTVKINGKSEKLYSAWTVKISKKVK